MAKGIVPASWQESTDWLRQSDTALALAFVVVFAICLLTSILIW